MAEASQNLRVVITAIDHASAKFHAINQQISAMSAPLRQVGDAVGSLVEESGLRAVATRARGALGEVRNLTSGIGHLAFSLSGLAAAASVGGLFELLKSTAEFGEKLHFGAHKTGMPTEQLAGWHFAAKNAGVETEMFDKAVQRLNRNLFLAAGGKAKDVAQILRHWGLPNTSKHLLGTAAALEAINKHVTALVAAGKGQAATAALQALMARGGPQLQGFFAQDDLMKKITEAKEYGIAPGKEETNNAYAFGESMKHLAAAIFGVELAAGGDLYPSLTKLNEGLADWIKTNRTWLISDPEGPWQTLKAAILAIPWKTLKGDLIAVGGVLKTVFVDVLGVKGTLIAIGLMKFQPLIIALGAVGWAAVRAAAVIAAAFLGIPLLLGGAVVAAVAIIGVSFANMDWAKHFQLWKDVFTAGYEAIKAPTVAFGAWLRGWAGGVALAMIAPFRDAFDWVANHLPSLPGGGVASSRGGFVPGGGPALSALPGAALAAGGGVQRAEGHVTFSFKGLPDWLHPHVESRAPAGQNLGEAMVY